MPHSLAEAYKKSVLDKDEKDAKHPSPNYYRVGNLQLPRANVKAREQTAVHQKMKAELKKPSPKPKAPAAKKDKTQSFYDKHFSKK